MKLKGIISMILVTSVLAGYSQSKKDKKNTDQMEKGLIKVTIMYSFAEGNTFDMEYYESTHMPMVAGFLGSNLVKYTIEKGVASGIPNTPMAYLAIGAFYVKNLSEYQEAIAPNREAIMADFSNYTNVAPIILISEVIK